MDSEHFDAPPTTTAALTAYFRRYGRSADNTDIDLVHFRSGADIDGWLAGWRATDLPRARQAASAGLAPVVGFSFYTWNAAEFLSLARSLKELLPGLLVIAGGPHVQQPGDYLGIDPLDVIFLGEAEVSFQEFLDCRDRDQWPDVNGLAYLEAGRVLTTAPRERCQDLDRFPSPLEVLQLTDPQGRLPI